MQTSKLFLVGTHRFSFQSGKPAEVIGVVMAQPGEGLTERPCFHVRFEDGREDYTPIFNAQGDGNSRNPFTELISEDDVRAGKIPPVAH